MSKEKRRGEAMYSLITNSKKGTLLDELVQSLENLPTLFHERGLHQLFWTTIIVGSDPTSSREWRVRKNTDIDLP